MPIKGMRSLFFFSPSHCSSHGRAMPAPSSPSRQTFSATLMEENISAAGSIITKWDPDSSSYAKVTSIFHESRAEARRLLRAVTDLQRAMVFFVSDEAALVSDHAARSRNLVRAEKLMQAAMRRLEREFHQILSANRDRLDPESVSARSSLSSASGPDDDDDDDEICAAGNSIGEVERASAVATSDLHAIAEAMISAGYGKECVRVYKIFRKSIIDEGLYRLGFERLTQSQVRKLDWEVLDLKIKSWLAAARIAVKTLFTGERILIDHVFAGSDSIRGSCFADITRDAAVHFFAFPELVAKAKKSPEKMFRVLDLFDAITDLSPQIESVFSLESTATVRSQALASLLKLAEAARDTLAQFEAAIQKDSSKSPIPGGGVHPLTRYVMDYVVLLADYEPTLADIYADFPLPIQTPLPESFFDPAAMTPSSSAPSSPTSSSFEATPRSSISVRLAWLVLVLLCKLDGKAEVYKDVALSYLFLANNLQYIVNKVRDSRLRLLLGDDWVARHGAKARHYVGNYEKLGWAKVAATVPAEEEASARMREFNVAFDDACRDQGNCVVADATMREEVRAAVARMIVPAYSGFYERTRPLLNDSAAGVVRFAPEDVKNRLLQLFAGSPVSGSGSGSGSCSAKST